MLILDAILMFLFLVGILVVIPVPSEYHLDELYILQKENDLLKVWSMTSEENVSEMEKDIEKLFPNQDVKIERDSQPEQYDDYSSSEIISTEAFTIQNHQLKKIRIYLLRK